MLKKLNISSNAQQDTILKHRVKIQAEVYSITKFHEYLYRETFRT